MDMTREALQYVVGLKRAEVINIDGENYVDRDIDRVDKALRAEPLKMGTLTSLLDYLKAGIDPMPEKMLAQVLSPTSIRVVSTLDQDRKREELVRVEAETPGFEYGKYMSQESFLIALQAKFLPGKDRELLLKFAGTVRDESIAEYGDSGVTQKATIKTGISTVSDAIVPNPVVLRPFRTFTEVEQPESSFVFRMRQSDGRGVECAVFEADGGAWKNAAMENVKRYLQAGLKGMARYTVIS